MIAGAGPSPLPSPTSGRGGFVVPAAMKAEARPLPPCGGELERGASLTGSTRRRPGEANPLSNVRPAKPLPNPPPLRGRGSLIVPVEMPKATGRNMGSRPLSLRERAGVRAFGAGRNSQ